MNVKQETNTVYILGAGFSMPFLPNQGHLLEKLFHFELLPASKAPDIEFFAHQATLRSWFEERFGHTFSAVWLEDVFTWFDHVADAIPPTEDVRRIQLLRRQLNFALAYYFIQAPPQQEASAKIRRRLRAMQQRSLLKGVITLNWDVLLERTDWQFDYGFFAYDRTGRKLTGLGTPLLKLHGSAHWWICAKCHSVLCDDTLQIFFETRCSVCGKDNTQFDPILMTPSLMKNPSQGALTEVWRLAFVLLAHADEIVFMGYSLPQADHAVFHLVSQAMRSNAIVQAVLLDKDKGSLANQRFQTLIPGIRLNFTGIDPFLGLQ